MTSPIRFTLADMLEENAHLHAQRPALRYEGRELTHSQLLGRARQLGSALEKLGLRRQDRVALLGMNSIEYVEVLSSGYLTGLITNTVNFRLAAPEWTYILNDSKPRVMILEAQYLGVIEQIKAQLPSIEKFVCIGGESDWAQNYEAFLATGDPAGPQMRARPEDVALLIYTSGTTGKPKGVMLGQAETRLVGQMVGNEMRTGPNDSILLVMPLFHIGALAMGLGIHARGGLAVLHRVFDPQAAVQAIAQERVGVLHLAPTLVQMIIDQPGIEQADLSSVHTLVYSAAPMPVPVLRRTMSLMKRSTFLNLYGMTEGVVTGLPREMHHAEGTPEQQGWLASVGLPFPNVQVRVVDEQGRDVPTGEPGEIVARTEMLFRGYWNNHVATLDAMRDGWYHTGDMGRLDEHGLLYLVDRKKDMIISGGENIYSREVEEAVLQHPAVSECAVIGLPDAKWGEAVGAVVVLRPGEQAGEAELIEHTRTLIASYKKPRQVIFTDAIPKLPTGKVNKVALREAYARKA